jgi:hypothetical protein
MQAEGLCTTGQRARILTFSVLTQGDVPPDDAVSSIQQLDLYRGPHRTVGHEEHNPTFDGILQLRPVRGPQAHARHILPRGEDLAAGKEVLGPSAATQVNPRNISLRAAIRAPACAAGNVPRAITILLNGTDKAHAPPGTILERGSMNLALRYRPRLDKGNRLRPGIQTSS